MPETPWIVAHSGTMAMECQRCGATYAPRLPVPVSVWVAMSRAFIKDHARCTSQPARSAREEPKP